MLDLYMSGLATRLNFESWKLHCLTTVYPFALNGESSAKSFNFLSSFLIFLRGRGGGCSLLALFFLYVFLFFSSSQRENKTTQNWGQLSTSSRNTSSSFVHAPLSLLDCFVIRFEGRLRVPVKTSKVCLTFELRLSDSVTPRFLLFFGSTTAVKAVHFKTGASCQFSWKNEGKPLILC